jgi:hypothetical protein
VTTAGVDDNPDLRRRRQPVEELSRPIPQRDLIIREIEIHLYCSARRSRTYRTARKWCGGARYAAINSSEEERPR